MRIALVPLLIELGNPDKNLKNLALYTSKAAFHNADVICLPEMSDIGDDQDGRFFYLADNIPGKYTKKLSLLAAKHRIYLITGLLERSEDGYYSSGVLIAPSGEILLKHRQIHNGYPYQAGLNFSVADTPIWRVSIGICGDVFEEDFIQKQQALNADFIFVPMDFCGDDNELGKISADAPPAFLKEWKTRFSDITAETHSTLFAVNALTSDTEKNCGACGGAFVYKGGSALFEGKICSEQVYFVDLPHAEHL